MVDNKVLSGAANALTAAKECVKFGPNKKIRYTYINSFGVFIDILECRHEKVVDYIINGKINRNVRWARCLDCLAENKNHFEDNLIGAEQKLKELRDKFNAK